MNKLKAFFLACVLASVKGCWCEDCTGPYPPPTLEPFYINNSGVTVKLTIGGDCEREDNILNCTQEIKNNDTLCNQHLDSESCATRFWFVNPGHEGDESIGSYGEEPAYFKIEFFTEPKVCLVFNGDYKAENDIRYWENYTLIKEGRFAIHFYSYTITPEHRAMAKEEYCDTPAFE
jgi:hypothetical protein